MLLASSPTGTMIPDRTPAELQPPVHAVLMLSLGEIDFDCPHVDARADERPLFYDEEPLSIWALAESGAGRMELDGLRNLAGSEIDPWPVLDREIHLSNMLKREDASLDVRDLYLLAFEKAARRAAGGRLAAEAMRVCCTRDLLAIEVRLPDGRPLRPRLADLRCGPGPLAARLDEDDLVLPVFDRGGATVRPGPRQAFLRRHAVDAQMRALLRTLRAPEEAFVDRRLCA